MRTLISDKIRVYDASRELIGWCVENLTVTNPVWLQMKKAGKEDMIARKHIPETMSLYSSYGNDLILPFGTLKAIWPFVKDSPFETRFNDNGQAMDPDMSPSMPLYDYQDEAVSKMVSAKSGILEGACGCGKTQMGIEIAKRIGKNALWLCHTGDLLRQTVARIHQMYPSIPVGTITEGKAEMVPNGITVSTVQTLVAVDPDTYRDKFDTIITDECFPAGTPIMTDRGEVPIESIKVGDTVLSYNHIRRTPEHKKVKRLFIKKSSYFMRIKTKNAEIVCTRNHPIYTKRGYLYAEKVKPMDFLLRSNGRTGGGNTVWDRIVSVESFKAEKSQNVYNLEVEDNKNYFAHSSLVHNCHHLVGSPTLSKMHSKVVGSIPARYKFGLSATPSRSDSMIKSMYAYIGCDEKGGFAPVWKISKEQTNTLTASHIRVDLRTRFSYDTLSEDGSFDYAALVGFLGEDEGRNSAIAENVLRQAERHPKQLVLCHRVDQCEVLHKKLTELGLRSVLLVGKVTKKKRESILGGSGGWDVIVGTFSLAKEGLDVPELSALHWAMVLGDKVATIQSAGRIERVCEGKPEPEIFDYVDVNYPYCLGKWKKRVSFLKGR